MPADSINNSNVYATNINSTGETLSNDMDMRINTGGDTISSRLIQSPKV